MQEIELLAPVGSWEALEAAVQSGADAVYLGGKAFNARQSANNFDEEELKRAVEYCHLRDVAVYITVNTLVSNEELKELGKYILYLYEIDVDAVILQDLGAAKLIRDLLPDLELHASTQMSTHNAESVKMLEKIGFKRVVLDREMSLKEIEYVRDNSSLDLEVFVHGALCVSYSGQCLMSSMIGGRSGNRGRCAQPCRMKYNLVNTNTQKEIMTDQGKYLLSPKDLNTLENIDSILNSGVKSLKIEGRLKRPEYVATVVSAYRKAIDRYISTRDSINISNETLYDVEQIFNRGFTRGYILGDSGKKLMSPFKPNNRGIKVGEVISYDKKRQKLTILLERVLRKGDGLEIWSNKGDNPGAIVENIFIKGKKLEEAFKGSTVEIPFRHNAVKGSPVYRTSDIELIKRSRKIYQNTDKSISIYGEFKAEIGSAMELILWDEHNNYVNIKSTYIVEKAQNKAIEESRIREQISKLGGTPYILEELKLNLEKESAISIGELNKLRRAAIEELNKKRANYNNRSEMDIQKFSQELDNWFEFKEEKSKSSMELSVSVGNLNQLNAILNQEVQRVYYREFSTLEEAKKIAVNNNLELIPVVHRIMSDNNINDIKKYLKAYKLSQKVMVGDLGALGALSSIENISLIPDFSLNIFNNGAIKLLETLKVKEVTLSPELTLNQISSMLRQTKVSSEAIVHGHLPVMVTKHCPVSIVIGKEKEEESCSMCRNTSYGLKDRLGLIFPLETNENCTVEILNTQKLCLIENLKELDKSGLNRVRLNFTNEDSDEIKETIKAYKQALDAISDSKTNPFVKDFAEKMKKEGYTKGHFFRGVI